MTTLRRPRSRVRRAACPSERGAAGRMATAPSPCQWGAPTPRIHAHPHRSWRSPGSGAAVNAGAAGRCGAGPCAASRPGRRRPSHLRAVCPPGAGGGVGRRSPSPSAGMYASRDEECSGAFCASMPAASGSSWAARWSRGLLTGHEAEHRGVRGCDQARHRSSPASPQGRRGGRVLPVAAREPMAPRGHIVQAGERRARQGCAMDARSPAGTLRRDRRQDVRSGGAHHPRWIAGVPYPDLVTAGSKRALRTWTAADTQGLDDLSRAL